MSMIQLILISGGATLLLLLAYTALGGGSPTKQAARRLQAVRYRHSASTEDRVEAQLKKAVASRKPRRHIVAGAGSRIDALNMRLYRSGKPWTINQYLYASGGLALGITMLVFLKTGALFMALAIGLAIGAGLPHFALSYLIGKRLNQFVVKFPDALELLVRGLRSGLPVTETLGIVASEVPGPVGQEFKLITDRIRIGKTMDEALQDTMDRLDTPEFAFFCITLAIQRETGGNLAETLANLADVLRKRAQMKLKVKAMSSEAKASAYILGSLPFVVFSMIYKVNPSYIGGFFYEERLIAVGLGGLVWLAIGAAIMAKMIRFEI